MNLDPALRERIAGILGAHHVVLFMKGTRAAPRCGFSAGAVGTLDGMIENYHDIDVLSDPDLRDGIKAYGNWPTIPQLYVGGELVGGADIIQQLAGSGELHALLGVDAPDRTPPTITITEPAAVAIREALADAGDDRLHVAIDGHFRTQFLLKPAEGRELRAESAGIEVLFDLASAQRARGLVIDWAETVQGAGLVIRNPNAPATVKAIDVRELQAEIAAGRITVIDVRPAEARALAPFPAARVLDADSAATLEALSKDTPLAFLCHHGNSSRSAAEHFRELGFRNIRNVEGGIDAWSREVDATVPRY